MPGRYAAFTFVDRITAYAPGTSARGTFHVPAAIGAFPPSLMAEATGQLAAWVAVAKLGFRLRPVAGIAHRTIYHGAAQPGDTLDTEIRIDSCEDDAVAYQGRASVRGTTVLELVDVVGPMLALDEFDDAQAMRGFFETLRGEGAPVDRFAGVDVPALDVVEHERAQRAIARIDVPSQAAFFDDHFPRRPVYPGTLLLDRMSALAGTIAREAAGEANVSIAEVSDVKLRAFTEPGARLELRAQLDDIQPDAIVVLVEARAEGQRRAVGSASVRYEVRR